jgi:hypothetical protein
VSYTLDVTVDGRRLSASEIRDRFGLINYGWEAHAVQDLKTLIVQHGRTYGRGERCDVVLRYRVNGGPEQTWVWRRP